MGNTHIDSAYSSRSSTLSTSTASSRTSFARALPSTRLAVMAHRPHTQLQQPQRLSLSHAHLSPSDARAACNGVAVTALPC